MDREREREHQAQMQVQNNKYIIHLIEVSFEWNRSYSSTYSREQIIIIVRNRCERSHLNS